MYKEVLSVVYKSISHKRKAVWGTGGPVVKNLRCNAGDTDSNPDLGRSHMPLSNSACEEQLLGPGAREPMGHN